MIYFEQNVENSGQAMAALQSAIWQRVDCKRNSLVILNYWVSNKMSFEELQIKSPTSHNYMQ